jgi:hypothetical protein
MTDQKRHFILAAEPFIKRGFATGTLHPYRIAMARDSA